MPDGPVDQLITDVEHYLALYVEARDCPRSQQDWRNQAVWDAKQNLINTWIKGERTP